MQRISVVSFAVETQHCSPCSKKNVLTFFSNSKFSSFCFGVQSVSLHPLLSFYRLYLNVFFGVCQLYGSRFLICTLLLGAVVVFPQCVHYTSSIT